MHQVNKETIDIMENANEFTKEDYAAKLEEHILDAKEQKMISEQINNQMKGMV